MARYHISGDGTPKVCPAKVQCRLGDDTIHYPNKAAAIKGAEERFGKNISTTTSSSKNKTNSKPSFSIPEVIKVEGYMGAQGWIGGNLEKLQKQENNRYVDNKTIGKAIRSDIKEAIASGFLPKKFNNDNIKYSVRIKDNTIQVKGIIDGDRIERLAVSETTKRNGMKTMVLSTEHGLGANEVNDIKEKLEKISNSYRYNNSNSMVDYFDTNFYSSVSVGRVDAYEKTEKSEKDLNKNLVDSVKKMSETDSNFQIKIKDGKVSDETVDYLLKNDSELRNKTIQLTKDSDFQELERSINNKVYDKNQEIETVYNNSSSLRQSTMHEINYDFAEKIGELRNKHSMLENVNRDNFNMALIRENNEGVAHRIKYNLTNSLVRNKTIRSQRRSSFYR